MAIKPKYATAIMENEKTVEFRKILFKKKVDKVIVYSSSPVKKFMGYFTIEKIVRDTPVNLWHRYNKEGCILERDFFNYYGCKKIGYAIIAKDVKKTKPLEPLDIMPNFKPPQSFCYVPEKLEHYLCGAVGIDFNIDLIWRYQDGKFKGFIGNQKVFEITHAYINDPDFKRYRRIKGGGDFVLTSSIPFYKSGRYEAVSIAKKVALSFLKRALRLQNEDDLKEAFRNVQN